MVAHRKALHLLGETLREAGVLVAVFGPIDALFSEHLKGAAGHPLIIRSVLVGLGCLVVGTVLHIRYDEKKGGGA